MSTTSDIERMFPRDYNLAKICGLDVSKINWKPDCVAKIQIPLHMVADVVTKLHKLDSDFGQVMCKEYGDDEDWVGIYFSDIQDWEDWDCEKQFGIPQEYETFEFWMEA